MRLPSTIAIALACVLGCEETGGGGDPEGSASSPPTGATNDTNDPSGSPDTDGGEDPDGPSPAAVDRCHDACDDQLLFDCIDADVHELCWNACPERSESDIELFVACVLNSAGDCDPGCLDNFLDADPVDPSGTPDTTAGGGPDTTAGGGPDTTSGGSTGASCEDACEEFLGRGCTLEVEGFTSCADFCASLDPSLHDFVAMCVEQADGCTLPPQCSFPGE